MILQEYLIPGDVYPGFKPTSFSFPETSARYVRLTVTKLGEYTNVGDDNSFRLQLAEFGIYNISADLLAAQPVIDKINALPSVDEVTLNDEQAVLAAEAQYNTLTQSQKSLVTNSLNIESLKTKIAQIKQLNFDTTAAQLVITKIASLSQNVTLSDKTAVLATRAVYDSLTPAQKLLVTNYSILTVDESVIQSLINSSSLQSSSQPVSNSSSQSTTSSLVSSTQPAQIPNTGDNVYIIPIFTLLAGLAGIAFTMRLKKVK